MLNLVGCNPSKAAEVRNDPTASKVVNYAMSLGFGRLEITNCFGWVATEPKVMKEVHRQGLALINGPENDRWLAACAKAADMVICAWGLNGQFLDRCYEVEKLLLEARRSAPGEPCLHALKLCKDGTPGHPLYLSSDVKPFVLQPRKS